MGGWPVSVPVGSSCSADVLASGSVGSLVLGGRSPLLWGECRALWVVASCIMVLLRLMNRRLTCDCFINRMSNYSLPRKPRAQLTLTRVAQYGVGTAPSV